MKKYTFVLVCLLVAFQVVQAQVSTVTSSNIEASIVRMLIKGGAAKDTVKGSSSDTTNTFRIGAASTVSILFQSQGKVGVTSVLLDYIQNGNAVATWALCDTLIGATSYTTADVPWGLELPLRGNGRPYGQNSVYALANRINKAPFLDAWYRVRIAWAAGTANTAKKYAVYLLYGR